MYDTSGTTSSNATFVVDAIAKLTMAPAEAICRAKTFHWMFARRSASLRSAAYSARRISVELSGRSSTGPSSRNFARSSAELSLHQQGVEPAVVLEPDAPQHSGVG